MAREGGSWSRRRVVVVVVSSVAVLLVVLGAGAYAALHSRLFAATTIVITGERHESPGRIEHVAGLDHAPTMLSVDPSAIERRLAATFPWIATVHVTQRWPHTVAVAITERTAVAEVVTHDGTTQLVDLGGRRLGPPGPRQVLPVLQFVAAGGAGSKAAIAPSSRPGLVVASSLPAAFARQVAVISVAADGWVTLRLTSPLTFILGTATDLRAKYEDVAAVIAHATVHEGDVVDVSVPQAMTVSGP
jgi:cell division protein FtsQ